MTIHSPPAISRSPESKHKNPSARFTYTFDQYLNFVSKTDGNANVQTLTYDSNNRLASITDEATGRTMGFTYTSNDRIASITGPITTAVPDGIWMRYQYDTPGNLISVQYADNGNGSAPSGFEYKYEDPNQPHNLTEKRNLAGEFLSSWQYNSQDRAFKNITRDGKGVTISYGNPIVVTDSHGVRKNYAYETQAGTQIRRLTVPFRKILFVQAVLKDGSKTAWSGRRD